MAASLQSTQTDVQSKDGYVRREGDEWIIGTSQVEGRIRLAGGQLYLVSLRNKVSGWEYQEANNPPAEIRFFANDQDVSTSKWHWKLRHDNIVQGNQGELQLDVELESADIQVTKHYVIYPGTSVIREWLTLQNLSDKPVRISQVEFLHSRVLASTAQDLEFNYLTGGGNYNGSQLLKTEPMSPTYQRTLDSNGGIQPGNYSSFLPLVFVLDRRANEGVAVGWDYLGHWRFAIGHQEGLQLGIDRKSVV